MMSNPVEIEIEAIYDDLIFCEVLSIVFEIHRAVKKGYLFLLDPPESTKSTEVCVDKDKDVFGNCQNKIQKFSEDIECPNCKRSISTTRFAPHLEKCFGKGRQSSRIASQKISSSTVDYSGNTSLTKDDGEDDDWGTTEAKKKRRRKKDTASNKKSRKKTHLNLDVYQNLSTSSNNSTPRESPILDVLTADSRVRQVQNPSQLSAPNHPPVISNKLIFPIFQKTDEAKLDKAQKDKNRKSKKKK